MTLSLKHHDLLKMYSAVAFDEKKLPFRYNLGVFGGTILNPIRQVTFWGDGWGINFNVGSHFPRSAPIRSDLTVVGNIHLHGDRERFEEDFILAMCSIP